MRKPIDAAPDTRKPIDDLAAHGQSRRRWLHQTGALAATWLLTACGSDDGSSARGTGSGGASSGGSGGSSSGGQAGSGGAGGSAGSGGAGGSGGSNPGTQAKPPPPDNLSANGRITVPFDADAAFVASHPAGTAFWLPDGTYTKLKEVVPKHDMSFVGESTDGVVLDGGGTSGLHAFFGNAERVVIARMTITNYLGADMSQEEGPIMGKSSKYYAGSDKAAKDWYLYEVNLLNNGGTGIYMGHRFKVVGGRIEGHNPTGLAGGRITGGLVHSVAFKNNGLKGAAGAAVNNAQIKMTWLNCGPWGSTDRDSSVWVDVYGNAMAPQLEAPTTFRVIACTFDCKNDSGENTRGVWFDLDCRDMEVAHCSFSDARTFGVFNEGSNGCFIHHNTFTRCGADWGLPQNGQSWENAYFSFAAVVCGASDNIEVEDNVFEDCPMSMIEFLGDRGAAGADWGPGGAYPVASAAWHYMIRNSFAPIAKGERATVGSSNNKWRRNKLTGSSRRVGTIFGPGIDTKTQANLDTSEWSDNVYEGSAQASAAEFYWDRQKMDYAAWKAAGRQ